MPFKEPCDVAARVTTAVLQPQHSRILEFGLDKGRERILCNLSIVDGFSSKTRQLFL